MEEAVNEMQMLKLAAGHPHVIEFFCGQLSEGYGRSSGYIVMEYCPDASLKDLIQKGNLEENQVRLILSQLASGIEHLYKKRVLHRDLKPDNILLSMDTNGEMRIKIADFGLATRLRKKRMGHDIVGSLSYMAPERLTGRYEFKSELWSIGIILYEMLTGSKRFSGTTPAEIYSNMKPFSEQRKKSVLPETISQKLATLVEDLLVFQPSYRMTLESFFKRAARLADHGSWHSCFSFCT